jgi:hypothetical protein
MKYKVVPKIKIKGYPVKSKNYKTAHDEADNAEKKKYPKQYKNMKKIDAKLPKGEYSGTHTRKGKIEISKKVPKKDRKTVALHEFVEWKADKRLCAKCLRGKSKHK